MSVTLFLDWERCPDGVELVVEDIPPPAKAATGSALHVQNISFAKAIRFGPRIAERFARFRSDRRETLHLDLDGLSEPLVLQLIAADSDDDLLEFMSRFGLLSEPEFGPAGDGTYNLISKPAVAMQFEAAKSMQLALHDTFHVSRAQPELAWQMFNRIRSSVRLELRPRSGGYPPRLVMRPRWLFDFLVAEAAMILSSDAKVVSCAHCAKFFTAGSASGKRRGAIYCSPRCRVAAVRARKKSA
jgi:hypothetical protein